MSAHWIYTFGRMHLGAKDIAVTVINKDKSHRSGITQANFKSMDNTVAGSNNRPAGSYHTFGGVSVCFSDSICLNRGELIIGQRDNTKLPIQHHWKETFKVGHQNPITHGVTYKSSCNPYSEGATNVTHPCGKLLLSSAISKWPFYMEDLLFPT